MSEKVVKMYQRIINLIGKCVGFAKPLDAKEFAEIEKDLDFVSVDDYMRKQKERKQSLVVAKE